MTINIFVFKGDLNGKIVVVRFFFVGYIFRIVLYQLPSMQNEGVLEHVFLSFHSLYEPSFLSLH